MRNTILIAIGILLLLTITSCKKDKQATLINIGTNYFPRDVGSWIIYDVDSIIHDANDDQQGIIDTISFQLKEVIQSEFTDTSGRINQRIERFVKMNDTTNWIIKDVWYSLVNKSKAEQVEENNRFIKLIFPAIKGKQWNGNAYNNLVEKAYEYKNVDIADTINTHRFDSVLTIVQQDYANIIEREYAEEKYARNIGLISKTYFFIDIQNESGIEYYAKFNSFGKN